MNEYTNKRSHQTEKNKKKAILTETTENKNQKQVKNLIAPEASTAASSPNFTVCSALPPRWLSG